MSSLGSESVLYDSDGSPLAVDNGVVTPSDTPLLMIGGSDGTNSRYITIDSSGRQIVVGAGAAGAPAGGVISIQGVASGTVVPISGTITANIGTTGGLALDATLAKLTIAQGTALGSNTQALIGGSVTTVAPTYTTGQISPLSLTTAGAIRIDGSGVTQPVSGTVTANAGTGTFNISGTVTANAGTGNFNNASIGTTGSAVPASATYSGFTDGTNLQGARVFDVDTGGGTQYVQGVNLRLSAGGGSVEFGTNTNPIRIDPTGTTTQPVSGTVTANAGTGNFTVVQATASNLLASVGGLGAAGAAVSGNPVRIGGSDGTNTRDILTDTSGRQIVIGAAANGGAVTGNPVLIAGSDGANARSIRTASDGTVRVDPTGTTTQPVSGTVSANQGTSPWVENVSQFGGSNVVTGTGTSGAGIPRVTVSNDSNILATQSGTWTVNQGSPNTLANKWPVQITDGTNTMPTGDVAGRAVFHQITDGTNGPVAVKASTTAPSLTDPALVVNLSPNRPATYAASTNGPVAGSTNATATTSIAYIWHTGTNTKRVEIYRIVATSGMETGANHDYSLRGTFITAENATPGGTTTTPLPFDRGDAASTITSTTGTFRLGATGAPTRLSSDMISEEMYSGNNNQKVLFDIHYTGKPIVLRASQAEGFEIRMVGNGNGNLSQAPEITITMYWMEI
jgi:hypothetical protein